MSDDPIDYGSRVTFKLAIGAIVHRRKCTGQMSESWAYNKIVPATGHGSGVLCRLAYVAAHMYACARAAFFVRAGAGAGVRVDARWVKGFVVAETMCAGETRSRLCPWSLH